MENLLDELKIVEDAMKDHREVAQEVINNYNMGFITSTECSHQLMVASNECRDAIAPYDLKVIEGIITYKALKQIS